MAPEISTKRIAIQSVVGFGILSGLLFGGAGTVYWPEAWICLLIQVISSLGMVMWMRKHDPELLKERMDLWRRLVKWWDKVIVILLFAGCVPMFGVPGLDAVRYRWSHVPPLFEILGFAGFVLSYGLIFWVIKTNPFSSATVEIQTDRGHSVISTGPYHYVRHPMYAGAILLFLSIPLALGSLFTFIPGVFLTGLIVVRTHLEDRTLHQELEGYATYAETVKYRLVPGVW